MLFGKWTSEFDFNALLLKDLREGDIIKVDFGVHVKGRIVDSAFTLSWNPDYENLLTAVREATDTGVRASI